MSFAYASALDLLELYRRGDASPVEVTDDLLNRIERLNPTLHCFLTITDDIARAAASDAERRYAQARNSGDLESLPPLLGVPLSLKDLADVEGVRTTYGTTLSSQSPSSCATGS